MDFRTTGRPLPGIPAGTPGATFAGGGQRLLGGSHRPARAVVPVADRA